jgi:DNA replication and repair protein RecF
MKLDQVQIQHFRNLESAVLTPSSEINFIFGHNGSGKSSLLEAIHYLGFARSFRTSKHKNVIQYESDAFNVFAKISGESASFKIGISRTKSDEVTVSVNGNKSSRSTELVSKIPVQIFTPQSSDLIIGSPSMRRKFLDWGLFHVEHRFAFLSNSYSRVLKQKNAILRQSNSKSTNDKFSQSQFWDKELITHGNTLDEYRKHYVRSLEPYLNANLKQFLPEFSFEITYHRGWEKDCTFADAIIRKTEKDIKNGFLSVGPHKADLKVRVQGHDAAEVLSRGQLRMLVAALQLAQTQYLMECTKKTCVFLLDDVGAELDIGKREVFIDSLLKCNAQLFVTAIESTQVNFYKKYNDKKMFHVEHGQVREEI